MKIIIAKSVAWLIAAIAALSSYGHQVTLLRKASLEPIFGIPGEWVTPLTVDSLAIIALIIRMSDEVTDRTRRLAMIPLILAGAMAIAANVATAHNLVQVIVGVWTVGAYIVAETFVGMVERKKTDVVEVDEATRQRRREAAARAVVTRRKNAVLAAKKTRAGKAKPVTAKVVEAPAEAAA